MTHNLKRSSNFGGHNSKQTLALSTYRLYIDDIDYLTLSNLKPFHQSLVGLILVYLMVQDYIFPTCT